MLHFFINRIEICSLRGESDGLSASKAHGTVSLREDLHPRQVGSRHLQHQTAWRTLA